MKKLVAAVLALAMMCGITLADEISLRDVAMQLKTIVEQYYKENYVNQEITFREIPWGSNIADVEDSINSLFDYCSSSDEVYLPY